MVSKQEVVQLLRAVDEQLATEEHWTQNVPARNTQGNSVIAEARSAVCWCLTGAVDKVVPMDDVEGREQVVEHLFRAIPLHERMEARPFGVEAIAPGWWSEGAMRCAIEIVNDSSSASFDRMKKLVKKAISMAEEMEE